MRKQAVAAGLAGALVFLVSGQSDEPQQPASGSSEQSVGGAPFPLSSESLAESDSLTESNLEAIEIALERLTSPRTKRPSSPRNSLPRTSNTVATIGEPPESTTTSVSEIDDLNASAPDAATSVDNKELADGEPPESTTTSVSEIDDLNASAPDAATSVDNKDLADAVQESAESIKAGDLVVKDVIPTQHNGVTHVYLQQQQGGIDVAGAIANVAVKDGEVAFEASDELSLAASGAEAMPFGPLDALQSAALALDLTPTTPTLVLEEANGPDRTQLLSDSGIAGRPIPARLVYQKVDGKSVRLAWEFEIETVDRTNIWQIRIDTDNGEELERNNLIVHEIFDETTHANHSPSFRSTLPTWLNTALERRAVGQSPSDPSSSYRVFAQPLEAPSFGERSVQFDPFDVNASPLGWHDTDGETGSESTLTVGNNVSAYSDLNNLNRAVAGSQPDGGDSHNFDFPIDFDGPASAYTKAAITNLFYWNNVAHDFLYAYGFDEEAGNFQFNNYGNGGEGGDHVHAEAQDGGGTNNANFYTPPDGSSPRMQMYLWTNPERDGDFDNGIILHEYGHGLSIRLTGGPSTSSCLNNREQAGEGWSDYLGLIATMTASDLGSDGRGIGTYALGQTRNGPGIRQYRYSTDLEVDPRTYSSIKNASVPHGVGSVFAAMLWEMTWGLIEVHGFDSDLARGSGGNNLAMQLVVDGLKLQTCSPGFIDSRDAILAADAINNQSANKCIIWTAFAKRGLGYSATQGSSSSVADGVEAFDLDPTCRPLTLTKSSPSAEAHPDSEVNYLLTVSNQQSNESQSNVVVTDSLPLGTSFVEASATCGGTTNSGVITFSLGSLEPGESRECGFSVRTAAGDWSIIELDDDFDSLDALWTSTSLNGDNPDWTSISTTDDPDAGFSTGSVGVSDKILTLTNAVPITSQTTLNFSHRFNIETGYDGGVVEISVDDGSTWSDIGPFITVGGYNSQISSRYGSPISGRSAFSGSQLEYATAKADLSTFAGKSALVRFRLASDSSITSQGWWIDDISIGYQASISNVATATSGANSATSNTVVTTLVAAPNPGAPGRPTSVSGLAGDSQVIVSWAAPEDNGDSAITGYTVTATPDGNTCSWKAGDLNCAVTGLVNGTSYTFAVVATNDQGNSAASASSAEIQPLGVPGQPTSVIGLAGDSQVVVSWTAPENNGGATVSSYTVTATPGGRTCLWITGDLNCAVTGLVNGTSYTFTVVATNDQGNSAASASSAEIQPLGVPGQPTSVIGLAGDSQVVVSWTAPENNGDATVSSYTVTATPGGRTCLWITGDLNCAVTGLVNGTSYTFAVVATNDQGNSAASASSAEIQPLGVPGQPTSVIGLAGDSQVVVSWTAPEDDGGSAITGYSVRSSPGEKTCRTTGDRVCAVSGLTNGVPYSFTVIATNSVGSGPASLASNAATPSSKFVGLTPSRTLESRLGQPTTVDGKYWQIGKRSARSTTEFQVTGRGGVTSDADAVVLNVTVTDPTAPGYLTIFPCGANRPSSSNLNYTTGQTVGNSVVAKVGAGGKICIYTHSATQLIIDTNGYFPTGSKFVGLTPSRTLESRQSQPTTVDGKYWQIGKRSARSTTEFQVTGRGGVTSDADAVVLNVTVTDPTAPGYLTIFPCGANRPSSSNLNYTTGQTVGNSVVAKVGAGGKICIYTHSATQLIIDTNGYFPTGSKFVGLTPSRTLESRQSQPTTVDGKYWQIGKRSARSTTEFQVTGRGGVTSDADAVVLNVTVTDPSAPGYLTIFPCGANRPSSSNLNYTTGQTVGNSVVAKVGAGGKICIYTHSATQLIIDTNGYFPTG